MVLVLHRRAAQFGHQQLGDHQAPHRRRPARLRLLRAHPRHRGGDARRRSSAATGTASGAGIADGMGEPQAARARRHDAGHRRSDRARDRARARPPPRCAARAAAAASSATARPTCRRRSRRRWLPAARACSTSASRREGLARWITSRSRASSPRSPTCSRSRARTRSRSARTATRPTSSSQSPARAVAELDERGLREMPGIGKDLAARIREIARDRRLRRTTASCWRSFRRRCSICCGCRAWARRRSRCSIASSASRTLEDLERPRRGTAACARSRAWARRRRR